MRFIILILLLSRFILADTICEDDYTGVRVDSNHLKILWCRSSYSIQDNYFYISEPKYDFYNYKVNHTSIIFDKGELKERFKDKYKNKFCSYEDVLKKISSKDILYFFTLIPSNNDIHPYCYVLDATYNKENSFKVFDKNSDIKIEKFSVIKKQKQYLYKKTNIKTKMYLIKGDKVEILEEKDDWLYILYHGKKDIKAWIPKSSVR